jgi:hypothetical protein
MTVYNKVKWVLGILIVFFLILTTNLIDRNSFSKVKDSVVSIYEDRLIAKNLILKLSALIHEKELALAKKDSSFFNERNTTVNAEIKLLLNSYQQTSLTKEEQDAFSSLKSKIEALMSDEANNEPKALLYSKSESLQKKTHAIKDVLISLSEIQLKEGQRQMLISQRELDMVELFTHIEVYVLVLLAIIIQVVVLYQPKKS